MYNRFLYQQSSDFGRRWPSPRTSLCPYKDSSSAPFYPMSPRGLRLATSSPPSPPSPPAPIPLALIPPALIPLGLIASQHQSSPLPYSTNNLPQTPPPPYRQPFPQTAPPSSLPIPLSPHAPQSPYLGHLPPMYFAVLQRVHSEHQRPKDFPTRPLTESPTRHSVCSG